ncbi:hypothetical protein JCM19233_2014 [Vibrio astriarenae]|nr:hypothetical protein JCM19233_2014 [Vibrio sp. C7]
MLYDVKYGGFICIHVETLKTLLLCNVGVINYSCLDIARFVPMLKDLI